MASLILNNPHWEAVTPETQEAFQSIGRLEIIHKYYLAGGTGLALHLGHRFSVDLDFFSEKPDAVGSDERAILRAALDDASLTITLDRDATFSAILRGVGISFFRLNLYPLIKPIVTVQGIQVASIEDIGAMKLAAIIGRGTRKDYVDLYYILQKISMDNLFQVAANKYPQVRTFAISATRALAYFEDAEALPMPQMLDPTPWRKMRRFLERGAIEAGRRRLEDLWG